VDLHLQLLMFLQYHHYFLKSNLFVII